MQKFKLFAVTSNGDGGKNLKKENKVMKTKVINIGIGGFGCKVAEGVSQKMKESGTSAFFIAIDSDYRDIESIICDCKMSLTASERFSDTLLRLEAENVRIFSDEISELGYVKTLSMDTGSNSWRIKAMASFIAFMNDEKSRSDTLKDLDKIEIDFESQLVFNVMVSLAGGTGSALALPVALYLKKYFKEKCSKLYFNLYGVCPDVFTEGMILELKTKSYANAFAFLTELNTVNTVALRKGESNIKIGAENSHVGILFDGADKNYHLKESAPFNKAYLFDRMSGVFSTEFHQNLLVDYIYNLSSGLSTFSQKEGLKNLAFINAYSVAEISLDIENIIDYVAKYCVNDSLNVEWIKPFKEIENSQSFEFSVKPKAHKADEIEDYCNKINNYLDNLEVGKEEKTAYILGRLSDSEYAQTIEDDYWLINYLTNISNGVEERLSSKDYNLLQHFSIEENSAEKKSKKQKLEELKYKAEEYLQLLNSYYFSAKDFVENENFNKLFLSGEQDNAFNLISSVIIEDDKYIHPTLALIRLSKLYLQLKRRVKSYCKLEEADFKKANERDEIPEKLLQLNNPVKEAFGYGALNEDRFIRVIAKRQKIADLKQLSAREKGRLVKENKKYVLSSEKDSSSIKADFIDVVENITNEFKGYYFKALAQITSQLILSYRKIFKEVSLLQYRIKSDVEVSSKEKVTHGVYYGIKTNQQERAEALKAYKDEELSNGRLYWDDSLGKRVSEYVFTNYNTPQTDSIKPAEELICNIIIDKKGSIRTSDFYKKLTEENVLVDSVEKVKAGKNKTYLKTALMTEPSLLTFNKCEQIENKTLFISPDVANYIFEQKKELGLRANTPIEAIDEFLVDVEEYETEIKLIDTIPDKKAYVVSEKSGIKISTLSKMNGDAEISIYKNEYVKAMENFVKYETPMWNPHVFDLKSGIDLIELK